jgi:hypothetical protein
MCFETNKVAERREDKYFWTWKDIIYMFEDDKDGGYWIPEDLAYYVEKSVLLWNTRTKKW